MTLSPVEQAKVSLTGTLGLLRWQIRWFALGAVTAPLLGWLGWRWRAGGLSWPLIVPAAALVLEPLARTMIAQPIRSPQVRWAEILAGAAVLCLMLATRATRRGSLQHLSAGDLRR
jgi:hypothetical protein